MILYSSPNPAPNPRRVRMFAAEKGMSLEVRTISLIKGEHKSAEFLAINPLGQTPTLVLDDGTVISESVSICRYLDVLQPGARLFGADPVIMAQTDMWIRRCEQHLGAAVGAVWVHTHPLTAAVVPVRFTDYGESNRPKVLAGMAMCNAALANRPYLASDEFGAADIMLLSTIDFAGFIGFPITEDLPHLLDWHARVSTRPSADA
jgi:glutathione S-transferase